MRGDLATKWWTPVSLRGVVSFAWISLLITAFMVGISWMRGDDHGTTLSLMALIANTVIVWILPEDVPARPVPEKFGLFLVCGASHGNTLGHLPVPQVFHDDRTNPGGLLDGIPVHDRGGSCGGGSSQVIEVVHG